MLGLVILFFVLALIAGILGFTGVMTSMIGIAKILFIIFLILFVISIILYILRAMEATIDSVLKGRGIDAMICISRARRDERAYRPRFGNSFLKNLSVLRFLVVKKRVHIDRLVKLSNA